MKEFIIYIDKDLTPRYSEKWPNKPIYSDYVEHSKYYWQVNEVHDISHCDVHFTDGSKWHGDGVEELNDLYVHLDALNPQQFIYLLSKGYWLFGDEAFDQGLIIDAKTLKG